MGMRGENFDLQVSFSSVSGRTPQMSNEARAPKVSVASFQQKRLGCIYVLRVMQGLPTGQNFSEKVIRFYGRDESSEIRYGGVMGCTLASVVVRVDSLCPSPRRMMVGMKNRSRSQFSDYQIVRWGCFRTGTGRQGRVLPHRQYGFGRSNPRSEVWR